jgi:hypothetical protein
MYKNAMVGITKKAKKKAFTQKKSKNKLVYLEIERHEINLCLKIRVLSHI